MDEVWESKLHVFHIVSLIVAIIPLKLVLFFLLRVINKGLSQRDGIKDEQGVCQKCDQGAKLGFICVASIVVYSYRMPKDILVLEHLS